MPSAEPDQVEPALVLVLHPQQPWLAVPEDLERCSLQIRDSYDTWSQLLATARSVSGPGATPLGPTRKLPDGTQVHVVVAGGEDLATDARWAPAPPPGWPEPVRQVARLVLQEDAAPDAVDPRRPDWSRRGWLPEVTAWLDPVLAGLGRPRTAPVEVVQHWGISAVLRANTPAGPVYVKGVPPIFRREAAVMRLIGARVPGAVPRLVAERDGWLVTDAAGHDVEEWPEGAHDQLGRLIADLQVATLDLVPELLASGCADRRPAALVEDLARVVVDAPELAELEPEVRAGLATALPGLTATILDLAAGPFPAALVHGDYHGGNVLLDGDRMVVVDWTDAAVGLPGMDVFSLQRPPDAEGGWPASGAHTGFARTWARRLDRDPAAVVTALLAALPAWLAMQAVVYDGIYRALEPDSRWEFTGITARYLRSLAGVRSSARRLAE